MRFSFRWIKNVADIETIRAIMYVSLDDQVKHSYFFCIDYYKLLCIYAKV